jgi:RHS repeat-associated protein
MDAELDDRGSADGLRDDDLPSSSWWVNTIAVDLNGTGSGSVAGSIACSGQLTTCGGTVSDGAALTFTATPAAGAMFTGWTGACAGQAATCNVTAFDGMLVVANFRASTTSVTRFYHLDAVGSVRALTDSAGAVVERHDFRPFGEDSMPLPGAGADPTRFAGAQRDSTKFDDLGARQYYMHTGRLTSPDPIVSAEALFRPQKWNRYAYGSNNPLRFHDPNGLDDEPIARSTARPDRSISWSRNTSVLHVRNSISGRRHWSTGGRPNGRRCTPIRAFLRSFERS